MPLTLSLPRLRRVWLAALLLLGLTWIVARTGLDLAALSPPQRQPN